MAATAAHSASAYPAYHRASWAGVTVRGLNSTRDPVVLACSNWATRRLPVCW
jgi:hypothetical protein